MDRKKILFIIFAPFLLNLAASFITYSMVPIHLWRTDPVEASKIFYSYLWSYQSAFMIAVQVTFGLALMKWTKGLYDLRLKDALIIIALVAFAELLFLSEYALNALLYGPSTQSAEWLRDVVSRIPLWARYMNALLAPFTAGIFEEIVWRGYGITRLEEFMSPKRAVFLQALAFALWHVSPVHVIFVFFIGLAYGYTFLKRRSLAPLIIAHVITDLIGFSWMIT